MMNAAPFWLYRLAALLCATALLVAGCNPTGSLSSGGPSLDGSSGVRGDAVARVMATALSNIARYHVDDVSAARLARTGLSALVESDRDVEMQWSSAGVRLSSTRGSRIVPFATQSASGLAASIGEAVDLLVTLSPTGIGARSVNSVTDLMLDAITLELASSSYYLTPQEAEQYQESLRGFVGVGVRLLPDDTQGLRVLSVLDNGPAQRAGVRLGDIIIAIDGRPVRDFVSPSAAVAAMGGARGSQLRLRLLRNGQTWEVSMRRARIAPDSVDGLLASGNVGLLRVYSFDKGTARELRSEMRQVRALLANDQPLAGWILDLRNNPGGFRDEADAMLDLFVANDSLYRVRYRSQQEVVSASRGGDERTPLVVLINQWSASASEIVAVALRDNKRAVILGSRSFGKGSMQGIIPLSNGGILAVTVAHFTGPGGRQLDEVGLSPTLCTANSTLTGAAFLAAVRSGTLAGGVCPKASMEGDLPLSRAIDLLNNPAAYRRALDLN